MKLQMICLATAAALWAGCSGGVKETSKEFNSLPPAVQSTVRSQAPNAEIASIDHKTQDGRRIYEIKFKNPEQNPNIRVAEDGTLIGQGSAVGGTGGATSIQTNTENAPPSAVTKPARPSSETESTPRTEETETASPEKQLSALPEAVQNTVKEQAPNAKVDSVKRTESNGRVVYEIKFKDKETNPTLRIAEDGTVVKEETKEQSDNKSEEQSQEAK
jgi:uncharacterized membrane protein YkoI